MHNPGLPETLWSLLDGKLWHATSPDGVKGILTDYEIRPAYGDRYQKSFSRSLESVSLFDFGPTARDEWNQFTNWASWFGKEQESDISIWLEIDRDIINMENLLDAKAAYEQWQSQLSKKFIPGVEACHRGPIPFAAVVSAVLIARDNHELFQRCDVAEIFQQVTDFEQRLS